MQQIKQTIPQKPIVLPDRTDADYNRAITVLTVMFNDNFYTNKIIKQKEKR
jgi:hypothetical protein